uniref:Glutamate-gated chloride channel n=1 Tax=Strigamia maritima TaxID=126957 RepID=T1J034_STRMM
MKLKYLVFFIFIVNLCFRCNAAKRVNTMQILDSITGDGYDNRIRPHGPDEDGDEPVNVKLNVYVRSISNIDDVGMNYKVQLTLRQEWNDERLAYDDMGGKIRNIPTNDLHKIWIPDLFFANEITARYHDVLTPNVLIRIYPNGNVLTSVRVSLSLSCPMNLKNFPLDRQICSIIFVSYAHPVDELVLLWREIDPVEITRSLTSSITEFHLIKYQTDYCKSRTKTGEYSCLRVDFILKREAKTYMLLVYIPNTMLVIMAWISFWIPQKSALIRSSVAVGSLLALFFHVVFVNGITLPLVPYTKAIDVWTGMCLTFVFQAFVEFIFVHCLWVKKQRQNNSSSDFEMKQLAENASHVPVESNVIISYWKRADWSHRIDIFFRIFYPIGFGIFNICYWVAYVGADSE